MNILDFQKYKESHKKISMVTCYDNWSAKIIAETNIDCILVGDTAAMIMHGYDSTIPATIPLICTHIEAVAKGAPNKFIIGDMPFCSYRKGIHQSMLSAEKLMQAGCHAIKLEGAIGNETIIQHMVHSGVPVIGHLGLTPQSLHVLGGFKTQGRNERSAQNLLKHAHILQESGCFAIVLECIPRPLAKEITNRLTIPTIGIGAGPDTSGQVLVLQDLLGLTQDIKPKFVKNYLNGAALIKSALNQYDKEVKTITYPHITEHSYA